MARDTRRRILETTWRLLERDPRRTRIEDVARAAKITRQGLYRHFPDRASLLVATARYVDEQLGLAEASRPIREARGRERIARLAEFLGSYHAKVDKIVTALATVREDDAAVRAAFADRHRARWQATSDGVRAMKAEGLLTEELTVDEATALMMAIGSIEFWRELTQNCGWSRQRFVTHTQRLIERTMLRPGRT
jgi:AcrR family transcriptional regulator